uniref:Putative protein PsbN n=1 Tax=Euglena gracilis TaxID=3039 RepID=PSBN_EUGGR
FKIISFLSTIFLGFFIISTTIYSIYMGFGPMSRKLKDPFEEHEN